MSFPDHPRPTRVGVARRTAGVAVALAALLAIGASAATTVSWLQASAYTHIDAGAVSALIDPSGDGARSLSEHIAAAEAEMAPARVRATIGTWAVVFGTIALIGAFGLRLRKQALALERGESNRRADLRLRRLIAASVELVVVIRAHDGVITYLSPAAANALQLADGALDRAALLALVDPADRDRVHERFAAVADRGGSTQFECAVTGPNGLRRLDCTLTNHADDPDINGLVLNAIDVTERATLTSDLSHQARHDALTGLLNRQAFLDEVERALVLDRSIAILLVDLDGFKEVNDTLGHAAGDRVLTIAAARLATLVRQRDVVARLGGDEFAILLHQPDPGGPEVVARRILATIATPIDTGTATEVLISASVGIAMGAPELDSATVLKRADAAMYEAKDLGRAGFTVYVPELESRFTQRVEVRAAIERGLANREFVLQYQPIHAVGTNHLVGFEALLRWQRADGTFMNPGEFLSIAEASGQIIPLGRWIVHAAMRQLGIWRQLEPNLEMAINVSPRQLGEPGFVDEIRLLLDTHGLPPALVTFEVTETMLVDDPERTAARLRELKALGVRLAIDDYGAGNAAINFLLTFPIDIVKFDRHLILALDDTPTPTEALIRSITSLAHTLELETVAEGIERAEQLAHVQALGCTKAQGYHLARPMFPDRAERYLLAHTGLAHH